MAGDIPNQARPHPAARIRGRPMSPPPAPRLLLGALCFALLAGTGVWLPYLALYLDHRGLTGAQVGWVLGAMGGVRIVAGPGWTLLADRSGRPARLLGVAIWGGALTCAAALLPMPAALLGLALVLASMFRAPAGALLDSEIMRSIDAAGRDPNDYGRIRLWGSVGFLIFSFAAGALADRHSPWLLVAGAGWWAVGGVLATRLPGAHMKPVAVPVGRALAAMARDPLVLALMIAAVPYGTALFAYDSLYALHIRTLGLPSWWAGAGVAVGVSVEIAVMAQASRLTRRIDVTWLVVIAALSGVVRYSLTAWSRDPVVLTLTQGLHGLTFGAWWVSAIEVFRRRVRPEVRATAISLFITAGWGLGPLIAGVLAAQLLDGPGTPAMFWVSTALAGVAAGVVGVGVVVSGRLERASG